MSLQSIDVPLADAEGQGHAGHVDVCATEGGGWDITATLDGRLIASRHCDDWHRAERACSWAQSELAVRVRRIAGAAA